MKYLILYFNFISSQDAHRNFCKGAKSTLHFLSFSSFVFLPLPLLLPPPSQVPISFLFFFSPSLSCSPSRRECSHLKSSQRVWGRCKFPQRGPRRSPTEYAFGYILSSSNVATILVVFGSNQNVAVEANLSSTFSWGKCLSVPACRCPWSRCIIYVFYTCAV